MPNNDINEGRAKPGVQSVDRALRLLQHVCRSKSRGGISLTELSQLVGLTKPSVYRLMNSLEASDLVARLADGGAYIPGPGLYGLAYEGLERIELRTLASPELDELRRATNETVHLGILESGDVVYIDKRESQQTIRMYSAVGRRAPVHCTGLGKAMMAHLPEQERKAWLSQAELKAYTKATITSREALEEEFAAIRTRHYALDMEEHEEHIFCVAAPVFNHTGHVVGAISVTMPSLRKTPDKLDAYGTAVCEAARSISAKLGMKPDSPKT